MEKLLKIFEKEVMKKEEYYLLFQLFEKTKKVKFQYSFFYFFQIVARRKRGLKRYTNKN